MRLGALTLTIALPAATGYLDRVGDDGELGAAVAVAILRALDPADVHLLPAVGAEVQRRDHDLSAGVLFASVRGDHREAFAVAGEAGHVVVVSAHRSVELHLDVVTARVSDDGARGDGAGVEVGGAARADPCVLGRRERVAVPGEALAIELVLLAVAELERALRVCRDVDAHPRRRLVEALDGEHDGPAGAIGDDDGIDAAVGRLREVLPLGGQHQVVSAVAVEVEVVIGGDEG